MSTELLRRKAELGCVRDQPSEFIFYYGELQVLNSSLFSSLSILRRDKVHLCTFASTEKKNKSFLAI